MKINIGFTLLFLPCILFSQNWIETRSFSHMSVKSDLIVEGVITKIETIEKDKKIGFDMPLKKAILQIGSIKKGTPIEDKISIYYSDTFTGCGTWPVIRRYRLGDSILLFATERNDSIFHNHAFDQSTSEQNSLVFAKRIDELIQIKKSNKAVKSSLLKEWIVSCAEDKRSTKHVSSRLRYGAADLLEYLEVKVDKIDFSFEQRQRIYAVLNRFDKIESENEGLLKIMWGSTNERYALILKRYLTHTNNEKYPDGLNREYLMEALINYYPFDTKLEDILKKYRKTHGEVHEVDRKRKALTDRFLLRV